jgi:L-ascorbate metabolism protein UlaG (beta-lactamase superfamily)
MTGNHASSTQLSYTWIGHATTVVQMDGVNIITDPVWGNRAAPISFIGPVRYRPPPCEIAELPPVNNELI